MDFLLNQRNPINSNTIGRSQREKGDEKIELGFM